jgi:hypothetical protein
MMIETLTAVDPYSLEHSTQILLPSGRPQFMNAAIPRGSTYRLGAGTGEADRPPNLLPAKYGEAIAPANCWVEAGLD